MKKLIAIATIMILVSPVLADWVPDDGHKMHYPQMPDPNGWDVSWNTILADDFRCTQTGDITDLHFWYSWRDDIEGQITNVIVNIWSDNPVGPNGYSEPNEFLWQGNFTDVAGAGEFTTRLVQTGDQGWYDPDEPLAIQNDHSNTYQLNIVDIATPFTQQVDTIYWVVVGVDWDNASAELGWKTSLSEHFNDDAVWWGDGHWQELRDPITEDSLDLAFVITPEPATMALLAIGGLVTLLKRKRKS